MARFTGSGTFTLAGSNSRIYDILFESSASTLVLSGERAVARNIHVQGTLEVTGNYIQIEESNIRATTWSGHSGGLSDSFVVVGTIAITGARTRITDNVFTSSQGLDVDADDCVIEGNVFYNTPAAHDSIAINADRVLVEGNKFVPSVGNTNSAVNVETGECNMIVGNDLGDTDDYATDALIDTGSNTQLFYPNDATYGDNFTDCGSGS